MDIYFKEEYANLYKEIEKGEVENFCFESELGKVVFIYIKRKIILDNTKYYDIITPYGYGGPLIQNCKYENKDKLISLFWEKFLEYAFLNKIICSFVRFHPIEKNYEYCRDIMILERISSTVCIDLKSEEQIWNDISSKCRNIIRKSIKNNVLVQKDENLKQINDFQKLYYDTMKKNKADEYYFFKKEFFEKLKSLEKKEITHFYALHDNKIVSSILVLMGDEYLHYYLSANSQEGYLLNANSLLLYEIAKFGLKNGYKYFHLGGGYGGDDTSLFKFKSSFHKNHTLSFYIGKKIFNQQIYNRLCQKMGINDKNINYFPAYRYKE
ncbi:hypothetical protein NCTC15132_07500 [Fusobacterium sp. oral taxon C10]